MMSHWLSGKLYLTMTSNWPGGNAISDYDLIWPGRNERSDYDFTWLGGIAMSDYDVKPTLLKCKITLWRYMPWWKCCISLWRHVWLGGNIISDYTVITWWNCNIRLWRQTDLVELQYQTMTSNWPCGNAISDYDVIWPGGIAISDFGQTNRGWKCNIRLWRQTDLVEKEYKTFWPGGRAMYSS